jgi:hypothetical protein
MEALLGGAGPLATGDADEGDGDGDGEIFDQLFAEEDVDTGNGAGRRGQLAALVFDLIGAYLDENADRVAQIAGQVAATDMVGEVLAEAARFTRFLTMQGQALGARLRVDEIRTAVLSRLSATLPPHHELAVATALDHFLDGRADDAVAAFGDGPAGDLIVLHTLTAYTAVLGTHLYAPGEFTSANLAVMGALMYHCS